MTGRLVPSDPAEDTAVLRRLDRIESRAAIQDLAVRYGFAVDDREFDAIAALFTRDAVLRTMSGTVKGRGVDAIVSYFTSHMPDLGPSNHVVHGHVVTFDPHDLDRATGLVSSHAEMWRDGKPMITAMRYHDTYRRLDGEWLFSERVQAYMYFVDVRDYAAAMGDPLRVRASDDHRPADWPLNLR